MCCTVLVLLMAVTAGVVQAGSVSLDLAYWAPDRGTPYQWFEGAKEIQSYFKDDYRAAGALYLYLRNKGRKPLKATDFALNGKPLSELREQEHSVVWWRLLPNPLPPGRVGEVTIRLREALSENAQVRVQFEGGAEVQATVEPRACPLRIETVGFAEALDEVFVVVEKLRDGPARVESVWLDGRNVTASARLLDPAFQTGLAPLTVRLKQPLQYGSYHVLKVTAAEGPAAACCVRAYDGWVPLGSYGFATFEEYARNGVNGYNNFGRGGKQDLESQQRLGMRGIITVGDRPPRDYEIGHAGLLGYCLMDEPDCRDYGVKELPHPLRIGHYAMEMERRAQLCRQADARNLTFLTIDLTYKPANFYIYGPIADVTNCDCYPLLFGAGVKMVREVVETARYGAGPRPLCFTFQGVYHDPLDPKGKEKQKYPRPPLAEEERIMLHYAIGAGARGLYNYIHCTEKTGRHISRGTREFPDLWDEIGRTYRALEHVAPLLALAHPTTLATSNRDKLWLRTLICGADALLLVAVNDDYRQERMRFVSQPLEDVRLRLPALPWIKPKRAWRVSAKGFEEVGPVSNAKELSVGTVAVAELYLVASDERLAARLEARYQARDQRVAQGILADWRARLTREGAQRRMVRKIVGEYADCVVWGRGIQAYYQTVKRFWNPKQEKYNAFEFGQNEGGQAPAKGAQWRVTIPPEGAGKRYAIYLGHGTWGQPGIFSVKAADGKELLRQELSGPMSGVVSRFQVIFPQTGEYTVSFMQPGPGPKGGRATRAIYVVPEDRQPIELTK